MAKRVKLNKVASAWLRALRSGDFKQTDNVLTRVDSKTGEILGNCCMGVLCELAVKAKIIPPPTAHFDCLNYGDTKVLPTAVREWAGLKSPIGIFNGGAQSLTHNNDEGKSFKQIARIIEQKAKELFV